MLEKNYLSNEEIILVQSYLAEALRKYILDCEEENVVPIENIKIYLTNRIKELSNK